MRRVYLSRLESENLLPGDWAATTPIPDVLLEELEKLMRKARVDPYLLLELHIRRVVKWEVVDDQRVGVVNKLTISKVSRLTDSDHTQGSRIRMRVVSSLGGKMVADGVFIFGSEFSKDQIEVLP